MRLSRGKLLLAGVPVILLLAGCLPPGTPPTFSYPETVLQLPTGPMSTADSVGIGDVTGDGRADLVVAVSGLGNGHAGALLVYPQTSSGTFATPVMLASTATSDLDDHVVLADVNGDGRLDAVVADGQHVQVYLQQSGRLVRTQVLSWSVNDIQVADVNGDGRPDLVTSERGTAPPYPEVIKVHRQQPNGTFDAGHVVGYPAAVGGQGTKITVADVDGDGRPDILAMTPTGFWLARQTTSGTFGKPVTYTDPTDQPGLFQVDMAVADINGDGHPDVITEEGAEYPNGYLNMFDGQSGGTFAAPKLISANEEPSTLAVADMTGDGRNDIVVSQSGYPQVGVLAQRTDGTLSPISLTGVGYAPQCQRCIAVGDLNGDHLMDVAIVLRAPTDKPIQVLYQHP